MQRVVSVRLGGVLDYYVGRSYQSGIAVWSCSKRETVLRKARQPRLPA